MPEKHREWIKAYQKFLGRGLSMRRAGEQAQAEYDRWKGENPKTVRLERKFKLLKKFKEYGVPSWVALEMSKEAIENLKVVSHLRKVNPRYRISRGEAQSLREVYMTHLNTGITRFIKTLGGKALPFKKFVEDYARKRFSSRAGKTLELEDFGKTIIQVLQDNDFTVLPEDLNSIKIMEPLPDAPEINHGVRAFAERVLREGEQRKRENQETFLRMYAHSLTSHPITYAAAKALERLKRMKYPEMEKRATKIISKIRTRETNFDEKPDAVKERIVQERTASFLAGNLAAELEEESKKLLERGQKSLDEAKKYNAPYSLIQSMELSAANNKYLLYCLARLGNQKYLLQQAIELRPVLRNRP